MTASLFNVMAFLACFVSRLSGECRRGSFGHCVILLSAAAAHADRSHNFTVFLQGNSAGEDHDAPMVRNVDAEELLAALRVLGERFRLNVECA